MYRCRICKAVSEPGEAQRRHIVYRSDGNIEAEIPVCGPCLKLLQDGVPVNMLARQHGKPKIVLPSINQPVTF